MHCAGSLLYMNKAKKKKNSRDIMVAQMANGLKLYCHINIMCRMATTAKTSLSFGIFIMNISA